MSSLPHTYDGPPEALVLAWHEEEIATAHGAAEQVLAPPATVPLETGFLTRTQLANQIGVSERTLDKHLADPAFATAVGAWKTSNGRMAHWRFPSSAPAQARRFLNGGRT